MCAFFGRGKNKASNPFTIPDMYKEYIVEYDPSDRYHIDYPTFVLLINEFNQTMMSAILNKGADFTIPFRMGSTRVYKRKLSFKHALAIDWATTNKIGKKVHHLNDHTGGYKFFFRWNKKGMIFKYHQLYRLVMTRSNKRELARLIKSGNDYYELT